MRIWSINPKYLDAKGLVAVWRESLLALAVLRGETKGYIHHPQLIRFRSLENPVYGMAQYLTGVFEESMRRSYHFNGNKIPESTSSEMRIPVTEGQIAYEWEHLLRKLKNRSVRLYESYRAIAEPEPHPLFDIIPGDVEAWERGT